MQFRACWIAAAVLLRRVDGFALPRRSQLHDFRTAASTREAFGEPVDLPAPKRVLSEWYASKVAGVRVDRLAWLTGVGIVSYLTYVLGSDVLNSVMVDTMGIPRTKSAEAFGPFATLLGLIYSVILGQIYSYYFDRQGTIQDKLFVEAFSLRELAETCGATARRHPNFKRCSLQSSLDVLDGHAATLLATGFTSVDNSADTLDQDDLARLLRVVDELEASTERRSPELVRLAGEAHRRASMARCERKSALYSELPPIQIYACTVISWVLLGGFLLVDLGAPRFEAVLFATLACCFSLISSFVDDLADPFGGSWTVDAAKSEVEHLIAAIAALRRDAETET